MRVSKELFKCLKILPKYCKISIWKTLITSLDDIFLDKNAFYYSLLLKPFFNIFKLSLSIAIISREKNHTNLLCHLSIEKLNFLNSRYKIFYITKNVNEFNMFILRRSIDVLKLV